MRAREFLFDNINVLQTKVKDLVDNTSDETLLNKIYAALNSGTLLDRLSSGLKELPDAEIRSFVDEISDAIIQAPGSYDEKIKFVEGLKDGYIDVDKMTNGSRHHFSNLLNPKQGVSLAFLFQMFNALKDLGSRVKKGPGEFAIAIMSPKVKVFGGGDLKIIMTNNEEKTVEVKAGQGTIGATGLFQHQKVPSILQKYLPNIDLTQNIGARALTDASRLANLDPVTLTQFADELVDYIFEGQPWANTEPLKKAIMDVNLTDSKQDGDDQDKEKKAREDAATRIRKGYLIASYSAYQKDKFDGVMLIDFERQQLKYFDDPEEIFKDIDTPQFNLYSKNKEWGGKLISPGVKLSAEKLEKPETPSVFTDESLAQYVQLQADYLVKSAQQRNPQDLDLRNPALIADVAATLSDLIKNKVKGAKIKTELFKTFPMLKVRGAATSQETPQPVAAAGSQPAAVPTNVGQPMVANPVV